MSVAVLTELAFDLLRWQLEDEEWKTPRMMGGRDGSHHHATLARLVRLGLAERRKIHSVHCVHGSTQRRTLVNNRWEYSDGNPPFQGCSCKGHCRYRRTPAGYTRVFGSRPIDRLAKRGRR